MVHVEGIRLDGSDLPRIIVYNHVSHSARVCVRDCLFFLPITVRCALASTGLAVLLLSNASQTYNPVSEKVGAGIMSRRPLASRRPSRFHDTMRLSTGLRGEDKKRDEERRKGDERKRGEKDKKRREEKRKENRRSRVNSRKRKRVTEGNYNILNPSVYVSMRQEMNDDSLYIRAVSSTQHEGASVSYSGCRGD